MASLPRRDHQRERRTVEAIKRRVQVVHERLEHLLRGSLRAVYSFVDCFLAFNVH
jgi:hypothetical protein